MDWIWKSLLLVIVGVILLRVAGRATIESNELIGYELMLHAKPITMADIKMKLNTMDIAQQLILYLQ